PALLICVPRASKFARSCSSVERSGCFRITPQANLPRSFTVTWRGSGGVGNARSSYADHYFRLGSHESMRCVAFRAEPITVVGQSFNLPHRLRVGRTIRRE